MEVEAEDETILYLQLQVFTLEGRLNLSLFEIFIRKQLRDVFSRGKNNWQLDFIV